MKTKVSERGQVSIPADVRRSMHIEPEQELDWSISGGVMVVRPVPRDPISAFRGAGCRSFTTDDLLDDRKAEREREDAPR